MWIPNTYTIFIFKSRNSISDIILICNNNIDTHILFYVRKYIFLFIRINNQRFNHVVIVSF